VRTASIPRHEGDYGQGETLVILWWLVTAVILGPLTLFLTRRLNVRRRLLFVVAALAILWIAEAALFVAIGDKPPEGSRPIDPREVR
jgi:hypothetical protein